jgi:hypothetical protein
MAQTDKQVLNEVFKDLRKAGFIARQNYKCCQSCAWAGMETEYNATDDTPVVFYHNQDADAIEDKTITRTLYLAWQGDGGKVREIVEKHGFNVDWDGTEGMRIGIKPKEQD